MNEFMKAPFPWFGGKSRVAKEVWQRFGDVKNYVEPFFGSGAVLLARPESTNNPIETVNDLDGYVANFWRAVAHDPDAVAMHADNPVNENDLHARHVWLVKQKETLHAKLCGDHDFFDAKIAGFWVWGICCWIAGGFCSGNGPWWPNDDGELVKQSSGQGINKQLPHLGRSKGINSRFTPTLEWMRALSERLRRVRVCSGDWSRVCGPSVTMHVGLTGIFLDPPYADTAGRAFDLYRSDNLSVAHDVRKWAIENGDNPKMRIALCGYEGEHEMPSSWSVHAWKANGGYGSRAKERSGNEHRERIWFSPHCLSAEANASLFEEKAA